MSRARLLALTVVAALSMPACDPDDFRSFFAGFEPVDFSTSPEPEVQAMGEAVSEETAMDAAIDAYDDYIATGQEADLEKALRGQPDPQFFADELADVLLLEGNQSDAYTRARAALLRAEAARLGANPDRATLERQALERLESALTRLMDAEFASWRTLPPAPGAPGAGAFSELCEVKESLEVYDEDQGLDGCVNQLNQCSNEPVVSPTEDQEDQGLSQSNVQCIQEGGDE
jgi:hypothetical protein